MCCKVTDVGAYYPHTVTYHPTCHGLRMLGLGDRPRRLLEHVKGLELRELPGAEECCGFGGTFAVKNAAVSAAMGADKARNIDGDRRRGGLHGRQLLPDAHRRHARPARARRCARCTSPRSWPARKRTSGERHKLRISACPPSRRPRRRPRADTQLRANLRHATHTIRDKRAKAVAELDDWAAAARRGRGDQGPYAAPSRPLSGAAGGGGHGGGGPGPLGGGRRRGQPDRHRTGPGHRRDARSSRSSRWPRRRSG